jgi:hypothetical protein
VLFRSQRATEHSEGDEGYGMNPDEGGQLDDQANGDEET